MKPGRARTILLKRLAFLEAKITIGTSVGTYAHDEARALRLVLDLDQGDEQRVVESKAKISPKMSKRVSSEELLRAATGALRDIQSVDVAGVLARIEKERAS